MINQTPMVIHSETIFRNAKPVIELTDEFVTRENILWLIFLGCAISGTRYRQDSVNVMYNSFIVMHWFNGSLPLNLSKEKF